MRRTGAAEDASYGGMSASTSAVNSTGYATGVTRLREPTAKYPR